MTILFTNQILLSKANITDIYQYLDLIPSNRIRNYMYKNNGDLTFEDMSDHWGLSEETFSNGATYGDLDNDGDLDLVVNNLDGEVSLFRNLTDSSFNRQFLRVKLTENSSNNLGVGAKVFAFTQGGKQMEFLNINRGFMSSTEPVLHFGFDGVQQVDSLIVEWADGMKQIVKNVEPIKKSPCIELSLICLKNYTLKNLIYCFLLFGPKTLIFLIRT